MTVRNALLAAAAAASLAVVAGCNDSKSTGTTNAADVDAVREVVRKSNDDFFDRKFAAACAVNRGDALKTISKTAKLADPQSNYRNCEAAQAVVYGLIVENYDRGQREALRTWLPDDITVDGDHAKATLHDPPPALGKDGEAVAGTSIEFEKQDGRWLIVKVPE